MGFKNQGTKKGLLRVSGEGGLLRRTTSGTTRQGPTGLSGLTVAWLGPSSQNDVLASRSVEEVHAWYKRLADKMADKKVNGQTPLSSIFLRHYLSVNNGMTSEERELVFPTPDYLRNESRVIDTLKYHRRVYLTEERARVGKGKKWAGVLPRWKNPGTHGWDKKSALQMEYHCLVEMPLWLQLKGTEAERDLLYSLRGFQLKSKITVQVRPISDSNNIIVNFTNFKAWIFDTYDFDYSEYITVPNPDYGSELENAIAPDAPTIRAFHTNARRMEQANLAAPYTLRSEVWDVTDPAIRGEGTIDTSKSI